MSLEASQVAQCERIHLPMQEMQETWVQSLGQGDSPGAGNGNALQYSCLRNPWTKKPDRLQSMGSERVRRN